MVCVLLCLIYSDHFCLHAHLKYKYLTEIPEKPVGFSRDLVSFGVGTGGSDQWSIYPSPSTVDNKGVWNSMKHGVTPAGRGASCSVIAGQLHFSLCSSHSLSLLFSLVSCNMIFPPPDCQSRRLASALCRTAPLISPRSILLVVFFSFLSPAMQTADESFPAADFCLCACHTIPA